MESRYKLDLVPIQSLKPNKLVLYNHVAVYDVEKMQSVKRVNTRVAPIKKFHDFKISTPAQKKLKEKISWLYCLAKSRYVKSLSGREIFNFKICFFE